MDSNACSRCVNAQAVEKALRLLLAPGQVTELRALEARLRDDRMLHKVVSGYFDDPTKLAEAASSIDSAKGIYFVPNPVNPALLARCTNRVRPVRGDPTTADQDIERRHWLLIDCDAVRPSGISATNLEHEAAIHRACQIRENLKTAGWPDPILADSGNGGHLLYRVDLPAEDDDFVKRVLAALNAKFGDEGVKVDRSVDNPARIWKLYGTMACKGDSTPDRPHRFAAIVDVPETLQVVPESSLRELAAIAEVRSSTPQNGDTTSPRTQMERGRFSIDNWIAEHGLEVVGPEPWKGGRRWEFPVCPWNPDHTDGSAFLLELESGAISAGCHHNGCSGKNWKALRDQTEPGWNQPRPPGNHSSHKVPDPPTSASLADRRWIPFPVDALPDPVRKFVKAGARALGCAAIYLVLPILAAIAAAIGNTRRIQLKNTWTEPAVLWTCIIGESGSMKSPACELALSFIYQRQQKAFLQYDEELKAFEEAQIAYDAAIKVWKQSGRAVGEEPPARPREPILKRISVSDTTIEALAQVLEQQPRGVLLARDELAGWLGSFDQYRAKGKGADSATWLSMHSAGPITVDRKTTKRVTFIPAAAVSIVGGIQPGVLARMLGQQHFEDGMAARVLMAYPPRQPKKWTENDLSPYTRAEMDGLFEELLSLDFAYDDSGARRPQVIELSPGAREVWIPFFDEHAQEQSQLVGREASAYSKLEAMTARFALLIHLIKAAAGDAQATISAETMHSAIELTKWACHETKRVYAILSEEAGEGELRELMELLASKGGEITVRKLMQSSRRYKASAELAEAKLSKLVTDGYAERIERKPPNGGWPETVFRLLPSVYSPHSQSFKAESEASVDVDASIQQKSPSDEEVEWTG